MEFVIERDPQTILTIPITPKAGETSDLFGDKTTVGLIGIERLERKIFFIEDGSPADKAGFQMGDDILSIDGIEIKGRVRPKNRRRQTRTGANLSRIEGQSGTNHQSNTRAKNGHRP